MVSEGLPASLLSVWAASDSDVWVVGGDPRDGSGPLVYHYDGTGWTKLDTGLRNIDLWWVYGFEGGPVFMSGANGTILRYENGTFTPTQTLGTQIVFGMWGATANDLWAVGGTPGGTGFAWHYDGSTWTDRALPTDVPSGAVWKVGGRAANDLWMACENGVTLHADGSTIESTQIDTESPLFSVAGNEDRFVTVGGGVSGEIYENDGSGWVSALPLGQPSLSGVTVRDGVFLAVGDGGVVFRRASSGSWELDPHSTNERLHAAFIDPMGGEWAVGGKFNAFPTRAGVLLHSGTELEGVFP